MRRYIRPLCTLLAAAVVLASCMDEDEEEVTLYDNIAITSFGITSAKIYTHVTSSTGKDSTVVVNSTAVSNYPFSIDHVKGEIYNTDSLPKGTDASKLLCSWSAKNNGMVFIENMTGDSLKYLETTDSMDFTVPRTLQVYSSDYSNMRKYKVTVNIHKEDADSFRWQRMADSPEIAALRDTRAMILGGKILVAGTDGAHTVIYHTADGGSWTRSAAPLGQDAYNNMVSRNDTLFVFDNGMVRFSTDGETFGDVATAPAQARLVGGSTTEMYALGAQGLMMSADGGRTWTADMTDSDIDMLPARDISYSCSAFRYNDSTDYVMLVGNRDEAAHADDRQAVVWRKIVEYSKGSHKGKWIYMTMDDSDRYRLPRMAGLTVTAYGAAQLALGLQGIGACDEEPLSRIYESRDGGITWKYNAMYELPEDLDRGATSVSAVSNGNGIWIVCGGTGQVWTGKQNSLGWQKE